VKALCEIVWVRPIEKNSSEQRQEAQHANVLLLTQVIAERNFDIDTGAFTHETIVYGKNPYEVHGNEAAIRTTWTQPEGNGAEE